MRLLRNALFVVVGLNASFRTGSFLKPYVFWCPKEFYSSAVLPILARIGKLFHEVIYLGYNRNVFAGPLSKLNFSVQSLFHVLRW